MLMKKQIEHVATAQTAPAQTQNVPRSNLAKIPVRFSPDEPAIIRINHIATSRPLKALLPQEMKLEKEREAMKTIIASKTIHTHICQAIATLIFGLFVLGFTPSILAQATSSQTASLGYSRDFIQNEQQLASAYLDRANGELESAQQRLSDDLPALAERSLILGFLNIDVAKAKMAGEEQRIAALQPGLFFHSHQNHLRAVCADLRARSQRIEDSLYQTEESQPAGITNGWKALTLYLSERNDFARQFQNRTLSPDDLISDIQLLQQYPLPLVLAGLINSNNYHAWTKLSGGVWRSPTGVDFLADGSLKPARMSQAVPVPNPPADSSTAAALKKLELRTSQLGQTVSRLRTEQSNMFSGLSSRLEQASETSTNATGPVQSVSLKSNSTAPEARSASATANRATQQATHPVPSVTVESSKREAEVVPAVAAPIKTHQATVRETPFSRVAKTNRAIVAATPVSSNAANDESKAEATAPTSKISETVGAVGIAKPNPLNRMLFAVSIAGALVLVVVVAFGLAYVNRRQADFEMLLTRSAEGRDESITIRIVPSEQCVVLNGDKLRLETKGAQDNQQCIVVRAFGGPVLLPGDLHPVSLNGEPLSTRKRLHTGDVIRISDGEHNHTFTFQGGNFVSPDEQAASLESTISTIN